MHLQFIRVLSVISHIYIMYNIIIGYSMSIYNYIILYNNILDLFMK